MRKQAGQPLADLIRVVARWHKTAVGFTSTVVVKGPSQPKSYTKAEFDSIDPRLFEILNHVSDANNGRVLRLSLELWKAPVIYVPAFAIADEARKENYHVKYVQSFLHEPEHSVVEVRVACYMTGNTPSGVLYARQVIMENLLVRRPWLDAAFPKWEAVYNISVAMDLNMMELTEYLLNPENPLLSGQLPDFD